MAARAGAGVPLGDQLEGVGHTDGEETGVEQGEGRPADRGRVDLLEDEGRRQAEERAEGELGEGQLQRLMRRTSRPTRRTWTAQTRALRRTSRSPGLIDRRPVTLSR